MTQRISVKSTVGAMLAATMVAMPTAAMADQFTPQGAAHWVDITQQLIAATNGVSTQMDTSCPSLSPFNGAFRREAQEMRQWAWSAHFNICTAFKSVSSRERGKAAFNSSTNPCKNLKIAADELGKAQPGTDPDQVVAAAGRLRTAIASLLADYKDAKTCKFARAGLF